MIAKIVAFSVQNRVLVFVFAAVLVIVGVRGYQRLTVDAVPDVTSVQVQILTQAKGLSPLEVESLVTRPIEMAMSGLPGAEEIRSTSRTAVSAVTIVFEEGTDLLLARQLVSQRLSSAREAIPASAGRPQMGPLSTGLGEVYHFTLNWPGHSPTELRTLLDWEIAYPLRTVPGVVEVNGWGGDARQIEVALRSEDLRALSVSQLEVEQALLESGENAGGGAIIRGEEQILVRLDSQYRSLTDVANQVVRTGESGTPILVSDVATVREGKSPRVAAATADGEGPTQYAMVQMIAGGNAHDVVTRVKARLAEIQKRLPEGVEIKPFYDRSAFVERVLSTVWKSLGEGGLVVALVLLLFLGDFRAGLLVATVIPLSMLGAFAMMQALGISGNLMSLGAIDFGLVVDGAVVIVEGALATMTAQKVSAKTALVRDAQRHGSAIAFGVMIIAIVYVPVLLLQGVEGKMFRPMGLTVLFALGTALILTFTWVPALGATILTKIHDGDPWVIRKLRPLYTPLLHIFTGRHFFAVGLAALLSVVGIVAGSTLGADFVPRLEEGDIVLQMTRPASVSVDESEWGTTRVEEVLMEFPEVLRVISRTGSPDVATDIMGLEQSDIFVTLRPVSEWTVAGREELIEKFDEALSKALPGTAFGFTQPIEMRVQELLGGAKSDVGIKLFGDDLATLKRLATEVSRRVGAVPGASDVRVEPSEGLPLLTLRPDPVRAGRLGVSGDELRANVEALREGRTVGTLAEGNRRFPVQVRYLDPPAAEVSALEGYQLSLGRKETITLGDVADVSLEDVPAQLSREQGRRRIMVEANVRGRDLASFVTELKQSLDEIPKPSGYYYELTGQYENLVRAAERLAFVVPATLVAIFVLLYLTFKQARPAFLILLNVPVAASGGLLALALRGLPFSVSAAVGLIALFGVATMNGVVLLSAIFERRREGDSPLQAARLGASERLRPVLTTAVVAALGFLPMALASGTGSEVQRPLATVVMGGLVTATLLTLLVLPALTIDRKARAE